MYFEHLQTPELHLCVQNMISHTGCQYSSLTHSPEETCSKTLGGSTKPQTTRWVRILKKKTIHLQSYCCDNLGYKRGKVCGERKFLLKTNW